MSRAVYSCVSDKNLPALRAAIAAGHSVNECGAFRVSPLLLAAQDNLVDMARVLLENGADIEAPNRFHVTPLDAACDYRNTEIALLLIARGATGNTQGPTGRTSLQTAVKRGLVAVVQALLETGQGDPMTLSSTGRDALYYVPSKGANAAEVRQLVSEYMCMDNAINSQNAKAIQVLLRRIMQRNDLAASVDAYLQASQVTSLEPFRVHLLLATIAANDTELFERVLLPSVPTPTKQDRLDVLHTLRFEAHSHTTALHIAAFYGHARFVEYLVLDCGMDPTIHDALRRRPVQLVDDHKDPSGAVRALLMQVTRRNQIQIFTNHLLTCSGTLLQLEELAQSLASVYDLRIVFSLSLSSSSLEERKRVLTLAFTRLMEEKLVFTDREALFCKMALREFQRRGVLTSTEFEYWDMQVVKINMESAPWVSALKQSVQRLGGRVMDVEQRTTALQHEYTTLRNAVQKQCGTSAGIGQSLSMFTSLLGVLDDSDPFASVLDLSSPQNVLAAMLDSAGGSDVASLSPDELVVSDEIRKTFEVVGVDPLEFAGLLKDAILSDEQDEADGVALENEVLAAMDEVTATLANVELTDIGEDVRSDPQPENEEATDADDDVGEDPLVAYPYHFAVKHSGGDLSVFQDVVGYIHPQDGDVNAVTKVTIASTDAQSKEEQELEISAVVYASYWGFADIVKWLLTRPDVVPTEKKFVIMQRAQQRATAMKEV